MNATVRKELSHSSLENKWKGRTLHSERTEAILNVNLDVLSVNKLMGVIDTRHCWSTDKPNTTAIHEP